MKDFLIGYASTLLSCTLCHPIDVVKTNVQTSQKTILPSVKHVIKHRLFFRGIGSHISTLPIFWGVFFQCRQIIPIDNMILSTYISATIGSFIANPLFVMKVRLQTTHTCCLFVLRQIEWRGLYSGYGATCFNNLKLGVQFPLYDVVKKHTDSTIIASVVSKGVAVNLFYPFDVIRNQQRCGLTNRSILSLLVDNVKKKQLYKGMLITNIASVPNFAIMMFCIENLFK